MPAQVTALGVAFNCGIGSVERYRNSYVHNEIRQHKNSHTVAPAECHYRRGARPGFSVLAGRRVNWVRWSSA